MAELFDVEIPTINEHLKNIFDTGGLDENSIIRKFLTTASDGKKYNTSFYNLDAIEKSKDCLQKFRSQRE